MNPKIEAVHLMPWNPHWWFGCTLIENFKTPHYWKFKQPTKLGINSILVFYCIDIAFLDSENKIMELKENLQEWTLNYSPNQKYSVLLEMPAGSIARLQLEVGQTIDLADLK